MRDLLRQVVSCLILSAILLAIGRSPADSQEVRPGALSGVSLHLRRLDRAAEKQGRTDWPNKDNHYSGTRVQITFSVHDTDITLVTRHAFGQERLLTEARRMAEGLGLPKADYITYEGRLTASVDAEFNKYLRRKRFRTDYDLDLSRLAAVLQDSALPRPIVLVVEPKAGARAMLQTGAARRELDEYWFVGANEVSPGTRLHFQAALTWGGALVACLFLLLFLLPLRVLWRVKARPMTAPPAVSLDPEEVQRRYDRGVPQWTWLLGMAVVPTLLFLMANPRRLFEQMFTAMEFLLPFRFEYLLMGLVGMMFLSLLVMPRLRSRVQPKESPSESSPAQEAPDMRVMFRPLAFMVLPMFALMCVMFVPIYTPTGILWRRNIVFGIIGLSVVGLPLAWHLSLRRLRTTLTDGPWFEMVQTLARQAGVRVKQVVLMKLPLANAYASIFGTVGLTTGLIEKIEPEDVRAVIAHELGHLKSGHPRKTLLFSLCALAGVWFLWSVTQSFLKGRVSDEALFVWSGLPLMFLVNLLMALIVGPLRRRNEREADRLAVQWIGDSERMIHALVQIHTLNASPARLKRSDEAVSSHPSLIHRIEAIRARGGSSA